MPRTFAPLRAALLGGLLLTTAGSAAAQQVASPRDTTRATIGGANLLVDYGRPSKRGREIFGGLEPWGQPWRTGANQATTLTTDRALVFGSTTLPAGTYALYTLPNPSAWKLIIHAPVPRWGIPYPGEQNDVARLDMTVRRLDEVVEQLEIRIEPQGAGGVLKVRWDRTEASIPFTVRQ